MNAIDWSFWLGLEIVEEWKLCALSVGIEPDSIWFDRYGNFYTSPHSLLSFDPVCFPTAEVKQKFDKRMRMLAAHVSNNVHFRRPSAITGSRGCREIYLSDFARWMVSIAKWDGLPPELVALAQSADPVPSESNGTAGLPVRPFDESASGLSRRERQIRAIESMADQSGYPRQAIPKGGKAALKAACKGNLPELFGAGDDPFLDSWKDGTRAGRFRTADHDKYAQR